MRAFPGEHDNETNTPRNCAAKHGDREHEHAACAKTYPENRAGGFGARSFEAEHREHAGADADDDNRGERRGGVADSDRRPVPAASARSGAGIRTTAAGTASRSRPAAPRDSAAGAATGSIAQFGR